MSMSANTRIANDAETVVNKELLKKAVSGKKADSKKRGFQERMFTLAFSGFVYPQIWEDPEIDIPAHLDGRAVHDSGPRAVVESARDEIRDLDLHPAEAP